MRKVAIFFSGGPSQDTSDILAATMEYQALNIKPALVFMRNAPAISQVLEVGLPEQGSEARTDFGLLTCQPRLIFDIPIFFTKCEISVII